MVENLTSDIRQQLKEAREAKGYSFEQLAEMTKIQPKFLKAIEEDDQDVLPSPFYTRAFAKKFASAVGLNPDDMFEEVDFDPYVSSDLSYAHRDDDGVVRAGVSSTETFKSRFRGFIPKIWLVILTLAVLAVAWFVMTRVNNGGSDSSNDTVHVASSSVPQPSSSISSSSSANNLKLENPQTDTNAKKTTYNVANSLTQAHKLVLKGQDGDTTVKVTDGTGKVLLDKTVKKDAEETLDVSANTAGMTVTANNISHLTMTINNNHIDVPNLPNGATTWNVALNFNK
ncbi:helix-turn-helix domain-containing protein [Fructobacillus sp. M1-13]|uniref:Helix-turn-helix domain-containing protein n=1 Tax=Fructobacillus papyriferae TaxID=2713171 RepID=A0ABS5QN01_9LACO|nr:helix-turn-helix domain-containing protein [Fructobacillus papyriferae]MBS9334433.1 helix-turn-helix domain-containing protein [Fructobacillus papyriferae]MCD2158422.1 helix-turn-helix domain-containing protein [Fructobacillus papyriferae]